MGAASGKDGSIAYAEVESVFLKAGRMKPISPGHVLIQQGLLVRNLYLIWCALAAARAIASIVARARTQSHEHANASSKRPRAIALCTFLCHDVCTRY